MKLSEELYNRMAKPEEPGYISPILVDKRILSKIRELESDSEMLKDLLEMIKKHGMFIIMERHAQPEQFYFEINTSELTDIIGSTPREAIAAAIKEWKK